MEKKNLFKELEVLTSELIQIMSFPWSKQAFIKKHRSLISWKHSDIAKRTSYSMLALLRFCLTLYWLLRAKKSRTRRQFLSPTVLAQCCFLNICDIYGIQHNKNSWDKSIWEHVSWFFLYTSTNACFDFYSELYLTLCSCY